MANKFEQLVEDLQSGALSPSLIRQAYVAYYQRAPHITEQTRSAICGTGSNQGLIRESFRMLEHTIGSIDLAVRRLK